MKHLPTRLLPASLSTLVHFNLEQNQISEMKANELQNFTKLQTVRWIVGLVATLNREFVLAGWSDLGGVRLPGNPLANNCRLRFACDLRQGGRQPPVSSCVDFLGGEKGDGNNMQNGAPRCEK